MASTTITVVIRNTKVRFYSRPVDAGYHVASLNHLTGREHEVLTVVGRGVIPDGFLVLEPGDDQTLYDCDGPLPEDVTALLLQGHPRQPSMKKRYAMGYGHISFKGSRWNEASRMLACFIKDEAVRADLVAKGRLPRDAGDAYVIPVKLVAQDKPVPKGAIVVPDRFWRGENDEQLPVYGVPQKVTGWSLTNLAYLANGRQFLAQNGRCYLKSEA